MDAAADKVAITIEVEREVAEVAHAMVASGHAATLADAVFEIAEARRPDPFEDDPEYIAYLRSAVAAGRADIEAGSLVEWESGSAILERLRAEERLG
jgi:hypothetical protein